MGMFNVLAARLTCPRCQQPATRHIQFRHGRLNLREYRLGDVLEWDEDSSTVTRIARMWCPGYAAPCPRCGHHPVLGGFAIIFDGGRVAEIVVAPIDHCFADLVDAEPLGPGHQPTPVACQAGADGTSWPS